MILLPDFAGTGFFITYLVHTYLDIYFAKNSWGNYVFLCTDPRFYVENRGRPKNFLRADEKISENSAGERISPAFLNRTATNLTGGSLSVLLQQ